MKINIAHSVNFQSVNQIFLLEIVNNCKLFVSTVVSRSTRRCPTTAVLLFSLFKQLRGITSVSSMSQYSYFCLWDLRNIRKMAGMVFLNVDKEIYVVDTWFIHT